MSDTPPFPAVPQTRHRLLRGSAEEHDAFVGMFGELTYDTTNKTARVHDGETLGGFVLSKEGHGHVVSDIGDLPPPDIVSAGRFLRVAVAGGFELADSSTTTTTESILDTSPLGRTLMRAADSQIALAALNIYPPGGQVFDVAGIFSFVAEITGYHDIICTGAGAGAGGAASASTSYQSASAGGNAGGTAIKRVWLEKGQVVPVTVGLGGKGVVWAAGNWGVVGEAGGTSSFGTYCSATGGMGSSSTDSVTNANHAQLNSVTAQAIGIGGDTNIPGGIGRAGHYAIMTTAPATVFPGVGGASYWAEGGKGATSSANPTGGEGYRGSGGGGCRAVGGSFYGNGGKGGDGCVQVIWQGR